MPSKMSMSSSPTTTVTAPISAPERSRTLQPGSMRNQETSSAMHGFIPGDRHHELLAILRPVAGIAKRALAAVVVTVLLGAGVVACGGGIARAAVHVETIGHSAKGRPIRAMRLGRADAPTKVLVVGVIHGTEPAGQAVIRRLRAEPAPRDVQVWLINTVNPDGLLAGTRQNARGVDLNRNFPWNWRPLGTRFSTYYSGALPLSEPESRAVAAFAKRIRPDVSIWYHQHLRLVTADPGHARLEGLYAQRSGLPRRRIGPYTGTAIGWLNHRFP